MNINAFMHFHENISTVLWYLQSCILLYKIQLGKLCSCIQMNQMNVYIYDRGTMNLKHRNLYLKTKKINCPSATEQQAFTLFHYKLSSNSHSVGS